MEPYAIDDVFEGARQATIGSKNHTVTCEVRVLEKLSVGEGR